MRKSDLFSLFVLWGFLSMGLMFVHVSIRQADDEPILEEKRGLVRALELTDLCLFTDARYTRHPSLADLHTPFQDHPMALEHFPSGSILSVPPHLGGPLRKGTDRRGIAKNPDDGAANQWPVCRNRPLTATANASAVPAGKRDGVASPGADTDVRR